MASSDDMAMADLETGEEEEVLRRLGTAEEAGLTDNEAARRLRLHGPNVVVLSHHEGSMLQRFLTALFSLWGWDHVFPKYNNMVRIILNSMSWVTVLTTMVSLAITSAGQRSCEMAIVIFIVATSLIACFIAKLVLEYAKAPLETKAHAPRAKVLRDGRWRDVHAANLVPGDIIFLKVGDIVPANARVLRFQKIDTMTCWAKRSVDCAHGFLIYYAWTVSCGQGTAVVIATGRGIPGSTLRLYPQRYARPGQLKEGVMLAGCFCASLVLVGTIAEIVLSFLFQKQNCSGIPLNAHFMPLIGGIPMAMPTFLYLALALGSVRLCFLGIASRGTVALEDLASVDVILFNMTGTLTCNQPCFVRDKIEMFADGVNKDRAIILAARASRSQQELYIEPIDAAILRLLDDPEQARFGVEVLEHHACFFVALKLMFQTTYIDESNGSKCCVFKGDPAKVAHQCGCSKEVKEKISMIMDELALDGYQAIAVDSCWEFIALLPYTDDLRSDSADAIDSLIDLGLDIRVLTESTLSTTKQVCGKLGKLGTNVVPAHSVFELARNNREVHSNINGISDLFPEDKSDIVRRLRNFGCHCAMVGYEFLDHDAIGESHIGISVADATDYTKSESDLVLTRPALIPVFSAVQISRKICQMMRSYTIFTISSTVHLFGIRVIFHLWNFDLSSILAFMITACNYCTSFAMLFERVELNKSPDKWRVQKIITSGAAFGSYIVLTTAIFYRVARTANPFACKLKHISLMGSDEEIRAALFLQMSTVNQAIALFVHSDGCCIIRCPGPFVTFAFVVSQMVATQKVVHGDLNFALTKGIGCVRAGLIWLYNLVLLLTLVLACRKWRRTKMTSEKLLTICMRSAFLRIVLIWFLYVILDVRVH
ncbi:plasma membrane ATPase-like isoform X2 [Miscanthus floridulus]|uniref:plasma membrane ATPase-like isoform X2 n=1 Tax=Miscanthus floridulus TaxID=154761 RepID=UPI00345910D0